MPKLKVGLIGCGKIAQAVHLPVLLSMQQDVEITALAEPDEQRRKEAAARVPSAHATANWQEVLERSTASAVLICLPTHLHAQAATEALSRGMHVYLEKPLATSLAEAAPVIDAWKQANADRRVGMIGFNYRFNPLVVESKALLEAGRIGRVVAVRSMFSHFAKTLPDWKQSRKTGGGVLLDLASHHADLVSFILNEPITHVSATVGSVRAEHDTATLEMRTASGVLVQSFFSSAAVDEDSFEFIGSDGKLAFHRYRSSQVEFTRATPTGPFRQLAGTLGSLSRIPARIRKILARGREPSYHACLSRFVAAALNREPTATPDLSDGYRSLAVIEAAEQSAAQGGALISVPNAQEVTHEPVVVTAPR